MGNMYCPPQDAAHLASVARDICPFPNYSPSPLFGKMLSLNSSLQLRDHYTAVQSSLTPKQLEEFTKSLGTTFGKEGNVTLGGVGVVALSLAVLFDTLARQVRGEQVSDSGPIPGLFVKGPRGYYPPHVYTASEYLRLVPHIANNPTRMIEETGRYLKQILIEYKALDQNNHMLPIKEDTTAINVMLGQFFAGNLYYHLVRINTTADVGAFPQEAFSWLQPAYKGRVPAGLIFNLNCDTEAADIDFLAKVQHSENRTQEAFESCKLRNVPKSEPLLLRIAQFEWLDVMFSSVMAHGDNGPDTIINHREHFDLKANALGKWFTGQLSKDS